MISVIIIFITLISGFNSSYHKFYLSVTQLQYEVEQSRITAISRLFIDDLETTLNARYEVDFALGTEDESEQTAYYISKYLDSKLQLSMGEQPLAMNFVGYTYQNDQIVVLCEFKVPIELKNYPVQVINRLLTDAISEQQNLVHFRVGNKKQSEVFTKERDEIEFQR